MDDSRKAIKRLIANNIKKYRAKAKLTQEEASEKADLSLNYWQRIEMISQKDIPSIPTLAKISKVLQVSLKDFFI